MSTSNINLQSETGKNSNVKNQERFSPSNVQALLIGLSIGALLSGITLAVTLTLWLTKSANTTTFASVASTGATSISSRNTATVITFTSTSSTSSSTTSTTSTTTSSTTTSTTTTGCSITATASSYWETILYDFDQDVNNAYSNSSGTYNGLANNSIAYISPGITGYGYAMSFPSSPQSFATIPNWIDLYNASFTIEFWLYLTSTSAADRGVFGQCQSQTQSLCLHILVQNAKIRFAFYTNDGIGATNLSVGVWYHIACVFARSSMRQLIYVNGILDYSGPVSLALLTTNTISTIGVTYPTGFGSPVYFHHGRIDQLLITIDQSKNASTVLDDATLTAYFSFDSCTSFWLDDGPLLLNGTFSGNVTSVLGKVGRAIAFSKSTAGSYFQLASKFVLLTVENQPHTYAFWIKPTNNSGTIIQESSGGSTSWSMVPMGYTSSGQISAQVWGSSISQYALTNVLPLNVWTHIAMTYSFTVGVKVYVNGSLYATRSLNPMYYDAPASATATLTFGYTNQVNEAGQVIIGQFVGAIDELRVYSRSLTDSEIAALSAV